jgi:transposase
VDAWSVEGTGCYGAALARLPCDHGQVVLEVNRPDRQARRRRGKSDPLDAEAAARAVQAGEVATVPKAGNATVEMIRSPRVARHTAAKARTQATNGRKALLVTAPVDLREQ